jgi:xanthine dehydrogenase YagS FAD-binding subunit
MRRFEHVSVTSLEEAFSFMKDGWDTRIIAGGTDLLGEMKQETENPSRLIDIKGVASLKGISEKNGALRIGGLVTLDELEKNELIRKKSPLLRQAVYEAASPQLRNTGTIAGNICQRPRCWYYRSSQFPCLRKGGKRCFAAGGENEYHAVFGGGPCHIVCPSDLAPALMALDATITIAGPNGSREAALDDFFVGPKVDPHRENTLTPQEIITEVLIPAQKDGRRSIFIKVRERQSWDFALASIALVLDIDEDKIVSAGLVLGGVAPNPWRASEAEEMLAGAALDNLKPSEIAAAVIAKARPLKGNRYKVDLSENLVKRALRTLLQG